MVINTQANTILDSLRFACQELPVSDQGNKYAVVSIHRYENLSDRERFEGIMDCLVMVAKQIPLKFILHPVTEIKLRKTDWYEKLEVITGITLENRMDYITFSRLLMGSRFLISDGGSNQEEASYMGLPCILMREKTERQEGLSDNVVLSNYDQNVVNTFVQRHINEKWHMKALPEIYPSRVIVDHLVTL